MSIYDRFSFAPHLRILLRVAPGGSCLLSAFINSYYSVNELWYIHNPL